MAQSSIQSAPNSTGASYRSNVNTMLAALFSSSSGTGVPSPTVAGQMWFDQTLQQLKIRNVSDTAWIVLWGPSQPTPSGNANNAVLSGGYFLEAGASNSPDTSLSWALRVEEVGSTVPGPTPALVQQAWALAGTDYMIIATRFRNAAGTWSEWRTSPVRDFSTYASTSGTSVEEIAIPIYARKIHVLMENVGTASAAQLIIRVRQQGVGVITSGIYNGGYSESTGSAVLAAHDGLGTGFIISSSSAQANRSGRATLERAPGTNKWFLNGTISGATNRICTFSGSVGMAGPLNGLRLQSNSAAYNAGEVTFTWET